MKISVVLVFVVVTIFNEAQFTKGLGRGRGFSVPRPKPGGHVSGASIKQTGGKPKPVTNTNIPSSNGVKSLGKPSSSSIKKNPLEIVIDKSEIFEEMSNFRDVIEELVGTLTVCNGPECNTSGNHRNNNEANEKVVKKSNKGCVFDDLPCNELKMDNGKTTKRNDLLTNLGRSHLQLEVFSPDKVSMWGSQNLSKSQEIVYMVRRAIGCKYGYSKLSLEFEKENIQKLTKRIKNNYANFLKKVGKNLATYQKKIEELYQVSLGYTPQRMDYFKAYELVKRSLDSIVQNVGAKFLDGLEALEPLTFATEYTEFYNSILESTNNSKNVCLEANRIGIKLATYISNDMNNIVQCIKGGSTRIHKKMKTTRRSLNRILSRITESYDNIIKQCKSEGECGFSLVQGARILRDITELDDIRLRDIERHIRDDVKTANDCVRKLRDFREAYLSDITECIS